MGESIVIYNPYGLLFIYYGYISLKGYCVYTIVIYPFRVMNKYCMDILYRFKWISLYMTFLRGFGVKLFSDPVSE